MRAHVSFVCLLLLAPVTASPQGYAPSTHIEAMLRARQGAAARARGDIEEALRLYREAVTLGAPPSTLRELAQCLEATQRWREAAGAWNRYAALALVEADRRNAAARAESLRTMLTALRVRVEPPAAARIARVWFDHEAPRAYLAGGVERVAEGGRHRLRVEAEGYAPWEMMVPTSYGEAVQVVAVLRRATR